MASGIYKIFNKCNDKIYIGSSINLAQRKADHWKRLRAGNHHSHKLQSAWNKYSEEAFEFIIIEVVDVLAELIGREQFYMDTFHPFYNMNPVAGSSLGVKRSLETRQKLSLAKKGVRLRPMSEEARLRIGAAQKGKIIPQEVRDKLRIAREKQLITPEMYRKGGETRRGRKHSEEHRKRISEGQTGLLRGPLSDSHRAKISEGLKLAAARKREATFPEKLARLRTEGKACSACLRNLPLEAFGPRLDRLIPFQSHCKGCQREAARMRRQKAKHPAK